MAQIRCLAPGCRSFGSMGVEGGIFAIHPALCAYQEILICRECACEATGYGVRTVEMMKARQIIRSHEAAVMREQFFQQFVSKDELLKEAIAA